MLTYSPTDVMVFNCVDKCIYRAWLTRLLRDAQYNQSANIYIESSSQTSEGSGVLMHIVYASLSISSKL